MLSVGSLKRLKIACLGNPAGTVGVCYETYDLGAGPGACFIFPNGEYDGFSEEDRGIFFDEWEGFCHSLSSYQFRHVLDLARDFEAGIFAEVWRS